MEVLGDDFGRRLWATVVAAAWQQFWVTVLGDSMVLYQKVLMNLVSTTQGDHEAQQIPFAIKDSRVLMLFLLVDICG